MDQEVAKMIPFESADGGEHILMSATNTGHVLRLDPGSGAITEIALV